MWNESDVAFLTQCRSAARSVLSGTESSDIVRNVLAVAYTGGISPFALMLSSLGCDLGDEAIVNLEGRSSADFKGGPSLLHLLAIRGDLKSMQFCIERGHDLNSLDGRRMSPLHYAILARKPDAARYLLSLAKCDASLQDDTERSALAWAELSGEQDLIRLFEGRQGLPPIRSTKDIVQDRLASGFKASAEKKKSTGKKPKGGAKKKKK